MLEGVGRTQLFSAELLPPMSHIASDLPLARFTGICSCLPLQTPLCASRLSPPASSCSLPTPQVLSTALVAVAVLGACYGWPLLTPSPAYCHLHNRVQVLLNMRSACRPPLPQLHPLPFPAFCHLLTSQALVKVLVFCFSPPASAWNPLIRPLLSPFISSCQLFNDRCCSQCWWPATPPWRFCALGCSPLINPFSLLCRWLAL